MKLNLKYYKIDHDGLERVASGIIKNQDVFLNENQADIQSVKNWLARNTKATSTLNKAKSSYGYKHTVEKALNKYISNGVFIAAAISFGYKHRAQHNGPNSLFYFKTI